MSEASSTSDSESEDPRVDIECVYGTSVSVSTSTVPDRYRWNIMPPMAQITSPSQTLLVLDLHKSRYMTELHESVCDMVFLEKLKLTQCLQLKSLPENIGNLRLLEEVRVWFCLSGCLLACLLACCVQRSVRSSCCAVTVSISHTIILKRNSWTFRTRLALQLYRSQSAIWVGELIIRLFVFQCWSVLYTTHSKNRLSEAFCASLSLFQSTTCSFVSHRITILLHTHFSTTVALKYSQSVVPRARATRSLRNFLPLRGSCSISKHWIWTNARASKRYPRILESFLNCVTCTCENANVSLPYHHPLRAAPH